MSNYLIIGVSSGIGKKLAEQLATSGHHVFGTYYKNKPTEQVTYLEYHAVNVLDEDPSLDFLPDSLAGVVYCPGSINMLPCKRIRPQDFTADFNLQVTGAIKVLKVAEPKLRNSDNAAILFFSSVAVQTGFPYHAQVAASKGAIEGLTKALAAEFAPKIRVNCIAPSLTETPLTAGLLNTEQKREANEQRHPLKRIGTTGDIANIAAFLLSEQASWITGQIMHVDGGISTLKIK